MPKLTSDKQYKQILEQTHTSLYSRLGKRGPRFMAISVMQTLKPGSLGNIILLRFESDISENKLQCYDRSKLELQIALQKISITTRVSGAVNEHQDQLSTNLIHCDRKQTLQDESELTTHSSAQFLKVVP